MSFLGRYALSLGIEKTANRFAAMRGLFSGGRQALAAPVTNQVLQTGLGAVGGGFVGNEATGGSTMGTLGGAVLGGAAMNPTARRMALQGLQGQGGAAGRIGGAGMNMARNSLGGSVAGGLAGSAVDQATGLAGYDTNLARYGTIAGGVLGGGRGLTQAARIMGRGPNAVSWLTPSQNITRQAQQATILPGSSAFGGPTPLGAPTRFGGPAPFGAPTRFGSPAPVRGQTVRHSPRFYTNPATGDVTPVLESVGRTQGSFLGNAAARLNNASGSVLRNASQFGNQALQAGVVEPLKGAARFAAGSRMGPAWMNASTRAGTIGRRLGMLGAGGTVAGGGYHMLSNKMTGDANRAAANTYEGLRQRASEDMDDYMASRGMMNQQGNFDPTMQVRSQFQQFTNPLLQMMGHDPNQMSGGQRAMALGGPAMMGAGMGAGSPLMSMLGMGMMGAPHLMQGQQGQHVPGQYQQGMQQGPQARNELETQRARQQPGMSGQGWL